MSDAPGRIWASETLMRYTVPNDPPYSKSGYVEYVRADLPPTLSAALALPEIAALVEAAKCQLTYMDVCGVVGDLERDLRAALAATEAAKGVSNG